MAQPVSSAPESYPSVSFAFHITLNVIMREREVREKKEPGKDRKVERGREGDWLTLSM